jgi:hypothetical protein
MTASAPRWPADEDEPRGIWDGSIPPGGFVCAVPVADGWVHPTAGPICAMPVESEPCPEHAPAVRSLRDRASDPAVVTAVASRLVGLLDHRVADKQAAEVITAVLDALEVAA